MRRGDVGESRDYALKIKDIGSACGNGSFDHALDETAVFEHIQLETIP
jgi:hypothetical protein